MHIGHNNPILNVITACGIAKAHEIRLVLASVYQSGFMHVSFYFNSDLLF